MKKVKILKSGDWAFHPSEPILHLILGEAIELPDSKADMLIKYKYAEEVKRGRKPKEENIVKEDVIEEKKQPAGENKMFDPKNKKNKNLDKQKKSEK